ncbi:SKP1-like protein 20 [Vicia villosa]|uniref:SKP1-like protein 20 n=1 Tax=Vicia villosa TaxID=3911 RepID=UPI00273C150A|nr:SKP1-like protein 20 [Vicia villosa]
MFGLILDYCRSYQIIGRPEKDCKAFAETFISKDVKTLIELGTAAVSLEITPLVDLTCKELAQQTKGKTPKEVSKLFHLNDDLDEEENFDNIKNMTGYSRILLFKKFSEIKNQELRVRKTLKVVEKPKDERSINDLLKYINGPDCGTSTIKKKKKIRRKEGKTKDISSKDTIENNNNNKTSSSKYNEADSEDDFDPLMKHSKEDSEDDLDPLVKKEIDREVEYFTRLLNLNWSERIKILPLGQTK